MAFDLTAEAVRAMVAAERAALARQEEFDLARQASPTRTNSLWSEQTLRHIEEFEQEHPIMGDEEEIVHEMLQLPPEAAQARLGRELSALTQLPLMVNSAEQAPDDKGASAVQISGDSDDDDGPLRALLQRVSHLESSNSQLQKTVSQLVEMVNELRGGGGFAVNGIALPTPSPAFTAAHQMVASTLSTQERAQASGVRNLAGRELTSPDDRSLVASLSAVRSAAEDRVARTERMERAAAAERMTGDGQASPVSSAVATWWAAHFGTASANEVVPFERMRAAAESELGPLSSVDVQLLRLELSDERGKLTKTALKRLLAGSVDGAGSHDTVGAALRSLLKAARAQLDRQVEVRMKQAASKSKRPPSGAPTPSSAGRRANRSPVERRVRLEFDN